MVNSQRSAHASEQLPPAKALPELLSQACIGECGKIENVAVVGSMFIEGLEREQLARGE